MRLIDLVATSEQVAMTMSRGEKQARLAAALRALGREEASVGVALLAGEVRQRQTGVGWAALRDLPSPAATPSLVLQDLDAALERIQTLAGPGSQAARAGEVHALFARATEPEQRFLRAVLADGLRQGASRGVVVGALAQAAGVDLAAVRRALMLDGDLGSVASIALDAGADGLAAVSLRVGRPVEPMLAAPAPDLATAFERMPGGAVTEVKLDGVRIQVHRKGDTVRVFSRTLDEVTHRVPEVAGAVRRLAVRAAVLDGEVISMRGDGRPHPFQVTSSRFGTCAPAPERRRRTPLTAFFFDLLHLDGADLLDRPASERFERLDAIVPPELRVLRSSGTDLAAGERLERESLERGHEGVVVKALAAPYAAGRRGAGWLKVKPRHTLDLVILAAEWGHGRRAGKLSNLHLGARGDSGFVMLGKTFKGLTDAMLAWQTERLLTLEVSRRAGTVIVRPELVVEVAFDGVQASSRYPGGVALRFARVLRHRPDKRAQDADGIAAVLAAQAT